MEQTRDFRVKYRVGIKVKIEIIVQYYIYIGNKEAASCRRIQPYTKELKYTIRNIKYKSYITEQGIIWVSGGFLMLNNASNTQRLHAILPCLIPLKTEDQQTCLSYESYVYSLQYHISILLIYWSCQCYRGYKKQYKELLI